MAAARGVMGRDAVAGLCGTSPRTGLGPDPGQRHLDPPLGTGLAVPGRGPGVPSWRAGHHRLGTRAGLARRRAHRDRGLRAYRQQLHAGSAGLGRRQALHRHHWDTVTGSASLALAPRRPAAAGGMLSSSQGDPRACDMSQPVPRRMIGTMTTYVAGLALSLAAVLVL